MHWTRGEIIRAIALLILLIMAGSIAVTGVALVLIGAII